MRLKLDENLGLRWASRFQSAGHDAATVKEQGLCSTSDRDLIRACRIEHRCLVTLDLGFANPLVFKPSDYPGIAVLRLPSRAVADELSEAIQTLISGLTSEKIEGKLWIVQGKRIREYQEDAFDDHTGGGQ